MQSKLGKLWVEEGLTGTYHVNARLCIYISLFRITITKLEVTNLLKEEFSSLFQQFFKNAIQLYSLPTLPPIPPLILAEFDSPALPSSHTNPSPMH